MGGAKMRKGYSIHLVAGCLCGASPFRKHEVNLVATHDDGRSAASLIAKSGIDDIIEDRSERIAQAERAPIGIAFGQLSSLLVDFLGGKRAFRKGELVVDCVVPSVDVEG